MRSKGVTALWILALSLAMVLASTTSSYDVDVDFEGAFHSVLHKGEESTHPVLQPRIEDIMEQIELGAPSRFVSPHQNQDIDWEQPLPEFNDPFFHKDYDIGNTRQKFIDSILDDGDMAAMVHSVAPMATTYTYTYTVTNVYDNYLPNKLFCTSPNIYPNLCNLRSAWMTCVDKTQLTLPVPNPQTCQVVLPPNGVLYQNRTLKAMQLKGGSHVDLNGKNTTILSIGTFNSFPVQVHNASFPFYTGLMTDTNFAQTNYKQSSVYACPGALLNFTSCNNMTSGDTYMRLFSSTGKQLAENDDYCGLYSTIIYELPLTGSCQTYTLHMGCYSDVSCAMKVIATIEQNPLPQLILYVAQKYDVTPALGLYNVTIANFGSTIATGGAISVNGNIQLNVQNSAFRGNYASTGGAIAIANNGNGKMNIFNVQCNNYVFNNDIPVAGDIYFTSNISNINIRGVTLTSGIVISGNAGNRNINIRNSKLSYYGIYIGGNSATNVIIDNIQVDQSQSAAIYLVQNIYGGSISNIQITNMHANGNWVYLGPGSTAVSISDISIECNPYHNYTLFVYTGVKAVENVILSNIYGSNCKAPQLSIGMGMYIVNSMNVVVDNVQIYNFRGSYGPGLFMQGNSNVSISNSVFSGGRSGLSGGGIAMNEDNKIITIVNTTVTNNKANGFGGGIYLGSANTLVQIGGCNITGNIAAVSGGGVFLSQSNYLFSMMDYDGVMNTAILETAHPYVVPYTDQGYTLESHSVIYNATVNVSGAVEFIITFDSKTQFQTSLSANFYTSDSDDKVLLLSYKVPALLPGIGNPSVRLPVSSFYFTFEGPQEKTYVTSGLWGLKLYLYPVIDNPSLPTTLMNNVGLTKGGAITFYYSNQYSVLTNLHIQGNRANAGGGLVYQNGNPSSFLQNVMFLQNKARTDGGGLMIQSGQFGISMKQCQWIGNQAGRNGGAQYHGYSNGAGVFFSDNFIFCEFCTLESNIAAQGGGGMYIANENLVTIMNSTLVGNIARYGDGGGIQLYQDSIVLIGSTSFEGNIAASKGGGIASEISNGLTMQAVSFVDNSARVGGGIATVNATAITFLLENDFVANKASDAGGAIYLGGSPLWTYNPASTKLYFRNNTASRGSAICMFESPYISPEVKITNSTFEYNVASVGGTIYWIYDSVMSFEPNIRSPTNIFIGNKAGYGVFAATQPIQMVTPVTYNVTVYDGYLYPPINATLYDFYEQQIQVDGFTAVYPSVDTIVGKYNCTTYPFLSGSDLTGSGVPLSSGVSSFTKLQASCSPSGSFIMNFVAQVAITSTIPEDLRDSYNIYNSTFVTFRKCRLGEYESNGQCIVCPAGTYSLKLGVTQCESCANIAGVVSCAGNEIVIAQGYWRRHGYSSAVLACLLDPTSCMGGSTTGQASCALGYEGPLCAVCSTGYYLTNTACQPCQGSDALSDATIAYIASFGFIILLIWIVLRYARPKVPAKITKKEMEEDSDDEEEAAAAAIPLDQQSTLTRVYLWARAKYGAIVVKVKIIVSTFQVISNTSKVMNVTLPNPFASFSTGLLFFNVAISVLPLGCMGTYNFVDTILWATLFPIGIAFLLLVCFCCEFLYIRHKIQKSTTRKKGMKRKAFDATKSKYLNYFFFLSYLVLPSVTTTLFQWFICDNVDPNNEDKDQYDLYLVADMAISCQTTYYNNWSLYVALMILIYPVGIPSLYLYLLRQHREELINRDDENFHIQHEESDDALPAFVLAQKQMKGEDEESGTGSLGDNSGHGSPRSGSGRSSVTKGEQRGSEHEQEEQSNEKHARMTPTARRLAFLWQAYKPKYWYWEIIETTRKLMLTAVLSVLSPGSAEQSIFGVIMAWAYITVYSYYQPYEEDSDNVLAAAGQIQIFFTFFAALIIQNHLMGRDWDLLLGIILTILNTSIIFLSFYFEIENYNVEMKEKKEEELKHREKASQIRMAKRLEFANKAGEEIVAVPVVFQKKQAKELVEDDPSTRMGGDSDDEDTVVNKLHNSSSKKKKNGTHSGKQHGQEVELTTFSGVSSRSGSTASGSSKKKFSGVQGNLDSDDEN